MNCIIVDDEEMSRAFIARYCQNIEGVGLLGSFEKPLEALDFLKKNKVDLVFLDIHMPEITGMDFLAAAPDNTKAILITSDSSFALESYKYSVIDYLVKPFTFPRFKQAIEKAKELFLLGNVAQEKAKAQEDDDDHFLINEGNTMVKVDFDDILFIEANGSYSDIFTLNKKHIVSVDLFSLEKQLPEKQFCKVHNAYIVNVNRVLNVNDGSLTIDRHEIPIGNAYKFDFLERIRL